MKLIESDEPEKVYYSIGEVSEMLGLTASLLRFWEKEFDVLRIKKSRKGLRLFTKSDIAQIRTIQYLLKEKGYTLSGAKDYLKAHKGKSIDKVELLESLKSMRAFLVDMKNNLP